jgi:hypothetical protein
MKCIDRKYSALPLWDQSLYAYEFEEFESIPTKTNFNFIHILPDPIVYKQLNDLVVFQTEFPNCLISGNLNNIDVFKYNSKIKKIITNCPFSVEYFNDYFHYDKFIFGFSPFNPKYMPKHDEKIYDAYYTGNINNSIIFQTIPLLEKFNSCFVCADYGINKGIGYEEKLALNAKSKISIVHGLLKWPPEYRENTHQFSGHKAFDHSILKTKWAVPQMKSRIMEAAASKSLILYLRDPWNVIESYFDPNIDFIYWDTRKDLEEKINHILHNYDDYIPIIDHAYNTLMENFTIKHFFEQYLRDL